MSNERHEVIARQMLYCLNVMMRDRMFGGVKNENEVARRRAKNKVARKQRRINRRKR